MHSIIHHAIHLSSKRRPLHSTERKQARRSLELAPQQGGAGETDRRSRRDTRVDERIGTRKKCRSLRCIDARRNSHLVDPTYTNERNNRFGLDGAMRAQ